MATYAIKYSTQNSTRIVGMVDLAPDGLSALAVFAEANAFAIAGTDVNLTTDVAEMRARGKRGTFYAVPRGARTDRVRITERPFRTYWVTREAHVYTDRAERVLPMPADYDLLEAWHVDYSEHRA